MSSMCTHVHLSVHVKFASAKAEIEQINERQHTYYELLRGFLVFIN